MSALTHQKKHKFLFFQTRGKYFKLYKIKSARRPTLPCLKSFFLQNDYHHDRDVITFQPMILCRYFFFFFTLIKHTTTDSVSPSCLCPIGHMHIWFLIYHMTVQDRS